MVSKSVEKCLNSRQTKCCMQFLVFLNSLIIMLSSLNQSLKDLQFFCNPLALIFLRLLHALELKRAVKFIRFKALLGTHDFTILRKSKVMSLSDYLKSLTRIFQVNETLFFYLNEYEIYNYHLFQTLGCDIFSSAAHAHPHLKNCSAHTSILR